MDVKRYFRGPLLWVLLFGLLVALVFWGVNPGQTFEKKDTSTVVQEITSGQGKSAKIIDKDQQLQVTLKGGQRQQASWVDGQGPTLQHQLPAQHDKLAPTCYNVQSPTQNHFLN